MASLKDFISATKSAMAGITGKADWTAPPAMTGEQAAAQTQAMLGGEDPLAAPAISLAGAKAHVDANLGAAAVHGLTGWAASALALAAVQTPGSDTTVARGGHRHPLPSAADVGALALTGGTLSGGLSLAVKPLSKAVVSWADADIYDNGVAGTIALWRGPLQLLTLWPAATLTIDFTTNAPPYGVYQVLITNPSTYVATWANLSRWLMSSATSPPCRSNGDSLATIYYLSGGRSFGYLARVGTT